MPQDQDKDLNRGGTMDQEGDLPGVRPQQKPQQKPQQQPEKRDPQRQQGGIGREPRKEEKQQIQPEHEVD
jgi:hypothetical protein